MAMAERTAVSSSISATSSNPVRMMVFAMLNQTIISAIVRRNSLVCLVYDDIRELFILVNFIVIQSKMH